MEGQVKSVSGSLGMGVFGPGMGGIITERFLNGKEVRLRNSVVVVLLHNIKDLLGEVEEVSYHPEMLFGEEKEALPQEQVFLRGMDCQ